MQLLIVEDDELLGDGMQAVLTQRHLSVDWVRDGLAADQALQQTRYELVVLDLNLPKLSGLEVLHRLRARGNPIPVIVLTARSDTAERVRALDAGADDYVVKPFAIDELCARIRALHRRSRGQVATLLRHRDLVLDPAARTVKAKGRAVPLSHREFDVLRLLLENADRVVSRDRLDETLYGWASEVESNAVEVHVRHLRKKLGKDLIRTVRGVGYIIERPC